MTGGRLYRKGVGEAESLGGFLGGRFSGSEKAELVVRRAKREHFMSPAVCHLVLNWMGQINPLFYLVLEANTLFYMIL